ncbi:MAG: hypothetical protein J0G32_00980 [Alphaproteobacteria bacterium]|nr:hypothetical protein [Alphaproteobacteria bacterium]OJV14196.1 MAG: hypothetical protein BGO27_01700 [Alphaproteobacteria bacterium 33-17]
MFRFIILALLFCLNTLNQSLAEELLIFPSDHSKEQIVKALNSAEKSIDFAMYRLEDKEIINILSSKNRKGIKVRVLLHKPDLYHPPFANSQNNEAVEILLKAGISVSYLADHKYLLSHYKFINIDDKLSLISTLNFDEGNYNSRNFIISEDSPKLVQKYREIFDNDFNDKPEINDQNAPALFKNHGIVLGPNGQRKILEELIKSANKSIHIYMQDLSDPEIGLLLNKKAKEGVRVEVIMSAAPFGGMDFNRVNHTLISDAGGKIYFLPSYKLYIHAKTVLIDPQTSNARAYVGSCNLWHQAISVQRELGIITKNKKTISSLYNIFKEDTKLEVSYTEALAK